MWDGQGRALGPAALSSLGVAVLWCPRPLSLHCTPSTPVSLSGFPPTSLSEVLSVHPCHWPWPLCSARCRSAAPQTLAAEAGGWHHHLDAQPRSLGSCPTPVPPAPQTVPRFSDLFPASSPVGDACPHPASVSTPDLHPCPADPTRTRALHRHRRHPHSVPAGLGSTTHRDPGLRALADSVPWAPPSPPVCPPCRPSWLSASTPSCRRTPARALSSELRV